MSRSMYDLDGWMPIGCVESDAVREGLQPVSSLTDPSGDYGVPVVYTEWGDDEERPALRDYRWPRSDRDCAHYVPEGAGARLDELAAVVAAVAAAPDWPDEAGADQ